MGAAFQPAFANYPNPSLYGYPSAPQGTAAFQGSVTGVFPRFQAQHPQGAERAVPHKVQQQAPLQTSQHAQPPAPTGHAASAAAHAVSQPRTGAAAPAHK